MITNGWSILSCFINIQPQCLNGQITPTLLKLKDNECFKIIAGMNIVVCNQIIKVASCVSDWDRAFLIVPVFLVDHVAILRKAQQDWPQAVSTHWLWFVLLLVVKAALHMVKSLIIPNFVWPFLGETWNSLNRFNCKQVFTLQQEEENHISSGGINFHISLQLVSQWHAVIWRITISPAREMAALSYQSSRFAIISTSFIRGQWNIKCSLETIKANYTVLPKDPLECQFSITYRRDGSEMFAFLIKWAQNRHKPQHRNRNHTNKKNQTAARMMLNRVLG